MMAPRATPAMKMRAALWLVLAIGVAITCGFQFGASGNVPVQTNLLALLPPTERNPVAETAFGRLADAIGDRAVFLIGAKTTDGAMSAARKFATDLRESGAFQNVVADIPPFDLKLLTRIYLQYRCVLLTESDRLALSSGNANLEGRLQRKLYAPLRFGITLSPAEDPFGFTDAWLSSLPLRSLKLEPDNGMFVTRDSMHTWVFVSAELPGSAFDGTLQQRVGNAVSRAENTLRQSALEAEVLRTGTVFYADAARRNAEREFNLIGTGSLLGMLILLYLVFRSVRPMLLGLLSVGFGIGAAVAVTIAVHGEMHLITLVFGAALIGEAIDYAVQYFAAHLGAGQRWEPMAGLRRIAPGLTVALATSLLGYGALMLAPFPALSQIAQFAFVGLGAAWLSVFLLLPTLMLRPSQRDPETAVAIPQRLLLWWKSHMSPRLCLILAALILMFAAPGWLRLTGNDDVRLLVARPQVLAAQEERIRELTGFGNSNQFFLVEAETPDAVLVREEQLAVRLNRLLTEGVISGYQGISTFVPSLERQAENRQHWQAQVFSDLPALKAMFARNGLRDEIADRQVAIFKASTGQLLHLEEWLRAPISMPFRHLWLGQTSPQSYAAIVLPQGVREVPRLVEATSNLPGVTIVDKAASVSLLFRSFRQWGALWLLGACTLVYGVLCVRYDWRQAFVTLGPTLLAMCLTLGIFGYIGTPLTLFNVMALMLVLGVGVNYAIFLREGGVRAAATLAGVILSAGTTLLSFGLLAFSSMAALSSFGLTLLIGVATAVLLAPIVLSFGAGDAV